jgi:hypothetical protein
MSERESRSWAFAGRWSGRTVTLVPAVLLVAAAAVLSYAVLLNVIIRDVPEPTTVAEDAVEIAEAAVAEIAETLLDDSPETADDVHRGIRTCPSPS